MPNEAKTMELFRKRLRAAGYYDDSDIIVEEQQSDDKTITRLLKNASKSGDGKGYPDFIIRSRRHPEFVIVVECKAEVSRHETATLDSFKDYACDGALLYASFLARQYDVVAIGFSGEKDRLTRLSHFLQVARDKKSYPYFSPDRLLGFNDYYYGLMQSDYKFDQDFTELICFTKELNETLQTKKIKESKRALLISAIMMALKNERFKAEYQSYESSDMLTERMYESVCVELDKSQVPDRNKLALEASYEFLTTNSVLNDNSNKTFVTELIAECDKRINGFMVTHKYIDTVSQFYVEFLRYANNDKGLGIVLTPPHITDLFTDLAKVTKESKVYDNCAGTGGFLISSMKKMLADDGVGPKQAEEITSNQLIGIEFDDEIYTLLISNMIMHHDGRTNIMLGDSLKDYKPEDIKEKFHPNVGLLNPPYKNKGKGTEEWEFVINNLNALERGGKCVAIIPISCVNETTGVIRSLKQKILDNHTLEGVLSLPEELFANSKVNTVTCAVILTAGKPHPQGYKTWFGYCRDDGFVKRKNIGRVDAFHTWEKIKKKWVDAFINRDEISEFSVKKHVTADMEWCAEAYLEADYTQLTEDDYISTVEDYLIYSLHSNRKNDDLNIDEV